MGKYVTAIDFGSSKIAVAVGQKTDSGIRIVSYHDTPSVGIKGGEIINDFQVEQSVRKVISLAEEEIGDDITTVVAGIGSRILHTESSLFTSQRAVNNSYISEAELDEMTRSRYATKNPAGEVVLEATPLRYNIDDIIGMSAGDTIGMPGKTIEAEYLLTFGKEAVISRRRQILEKCGIDIYKAILSPIGSARAVLTEPEMENGAILMDIGKDTTEIIAVKENIIRSIATIPFGGESITTDIKNVTNVTAKWAEEVKIARGCCCEEFVPENTKLVLRGNEGAVEDEIEYSLLTRIIEARVSEILDAARYLIDNNPATAKMSCGVVMTGGTCYLENIKQLAQAILGRKVRLAAPRSTITTDSVEDAYDAYSSTVVGLVLEGMKPLLSHAIANSSTRTAAQTTQTTQTVQEQKTGFFEGLFSDKSNNSEADRKRKEEEKRRKEEEKRKKEEAKRLKKASESRDLFTDFFGPDPNEA